MHSALKRERGFRRAGAADESKDGGRCGSPAWMLQDAARVPGIYPAASAHDSTHGRQGSRRNPKEALCREKLQGGMSGVADENREGWDYQPRPLLGAFPMVERRGQLWWLGAELQT